MILLGLFSIEVLLAVVLVDGLGANFIDLDPEGVPVLGIFISEVDTLYIDDYVVQQIDQ
jgi:hypothetical protein